MTTKTVIFIVLFFYFSSLILAQTNQECNERALHFSGNICEENSVTYRKLKEEHSLCSNLVLLGFLPIIEKYVFLTIQSTVILYGHENDISEKKIFFKPFNMTGVKIVKAIIKNDTIFLQTEKSHVHYTLVLSKWNENNINAIYYPWGKIKTTIYIHTCKDFYIFNIQKNTVVQKEMEYKNKRFNALKRHNVTYSENVISLEQTNPSKITVKTSKGKIFDQYIIDFNEMYIIATTLSVEKTTQNILISFLSILLKPVGIISTLSIALIFAIIVIICLCCNTRRIRPNRTPRRAPMENVTPQSSEITEERSLLKEIPSNIRTGEPRVVYFGLSWSNNVRDSETLGNTDPRSSSVQ